MTGAKVTYIPFKNCSVLKPAAPSRIVYENIAHLPWRKSRDGATVLTNFPTQLPENAKLVQSNEEVFVIRVEGDSTTEQLGSYQKLVQLNLTVSVLRENFLFTANGSFKKEFLTHLDSVSQFNKISIIVTNDQQDVYEIAFVGNPDNVKNGENKLRILIDHLNPIIYTDFIDLGTISLLPLVGGIELNNFKQVANQTNCHLYLPTISSSGNNSGISPDSRIYVSGLKSQVLLTKNLISKIKKNITSPFIKNVPLELSKKTILLLTGKQEALTSIMYRNECFIQLPSLESTDSVVLFQANNLDAIEKAIEEFIALASQIYGVVCESTELFSDNASQMFLADLCSYGKCLIEVKEKAITITGFRSEIRNTILLLSNYQSKIPSLQSISCIRYSLELNNEERQFIGGKKNGKLLKIMNNTGSVVHIVPYSDFSFILELNCPSVHSSISGLQLIEDELPTVVTFNIPESFHRQIIGVGGSTVQTIMRRYNVFIKFSNTFVFNGVEDLDNMDYNPIQSFIRKSNVVIKCPAKNGANIPYAKLELDKLVQNCSNVTYRNTFIKLSRSHWRLLSNNSIGINNDVKNLSKNSSNSTFIIDLEKRTNTLIKFPESEPISLQLLEIKGVMRNSEQCAKAFEEYLPRDYEFKLAYNPKFAEIANFDRNSKRALQNNNDLMNGIGYRFLNEITVPLKLLYNMEVQVFYNPKLENDEEDLFNNNSTENGEGHYKSASLSSITGRNFINDIKNHSPLSPNFEFYSQQVNNKELPQFHSILLSYFEEEVDQKTLDKCLDILTSFLRDNKIIIIDKSFNEGKGYVVDGSSFEDAQVLSHSTHSEFNKENINVKQHQQFSMLPPYQTQEQNQQYYNYTSNQPQQSQYKYMAQNLENPLPSNNYQNGGYFQ